MARHASHKQAGFTMIELLVVISIIAILIGLIVPAVQKVREAAARTQSLNNLHQMSIAVHSANDVYRRLPPVANTYPGTSYVSGPPPNRGTIFYQLLPFIEQINVYRSVVVDSSMSTGTAVQVYIAPGDPTAPGSSLHADYGNRGALSYAANLMVFGNAPGGTLSIAKLSILDGTSNTISFIERYAACLSPPAPANYYRAWGENTQLANGYSVYWPIRTPGPYTPPGHVAVSIDLPQFNATIPTCNYQLVNSFTAGGIGVGLADGSTHFVNPTVSANTWTNLIRPDDGNPLDSDW